ncbi:MAG: hypothetical protein RL500_2162, partial [Pseudomonadota bacterium]
SWISSQNFIKDGLNQNADKAAVAAFSKLTIDGL